MILLQLKKTGPIVKRVVLFSSSKFLSRRDMTSVVESDVKTHHFLPV